MRWSLLCLLVLLAGCQAQWGVAPRPQAHDPEAGDAHLGDAETARLVRLRDRLQRRLEQAEQRLIDGYDEQVAERRLLLTVALAELGALIERRHATLRRGLTNPEHEDFPQDEDALIARVAARVALTRRHDAARRRDVSTGPKTGDGYIDAPFEELAKERDDAEDVGVDEAPDRAQRMERERRRRRGGGKASKKKAPSAARVLTDDAPPPDVLPAVLRERARLEACLPPDVGSEIIALAVTARLSSPGRLRDARVVATPPVSPAVSACLAGALQTIVVPVAREERLVRFMLTVGD